jgi:hypothetical protein
MKAVYRRAAIGADEREALASFFAVPPGDLPVSPSYRAGLEFAFTGVAGACLAAMVFAAAWRRRFSGVRQPFLDRARRRLPGGQR